MTCSSCGGVTTGGVYCPECRREYEAARRIAPPPPLTHSGSRRQRIPQRDHWKVLRPHLCSAGLDPVRIETKGALGVPDVNYRDGWLELKQIPHWPRQESTPVRAGLSPAQCAWIQRRVGAGGEVAVSLMIGSDTAKDAELVIVPGLFAADAETSDYPRVRWEVMDLRNAKPVPPIAAALMGV